MKIYTLCLVLVLSVALPAFGQSDSEGQIDPGLAAAGDLEDQMNQALVAQGLLMVLPNRARCEVLILSSPNAAVVVFTDSGGNYITAQMITDQTVRVNFLRLIEPLNLDTLMTSRDVHTYSEMKSNPNLSSDNVDMFKRFIGFAKAQGLLNCENYLGS